jgi:hypothetical protein
MGRIKAERRNGEFRDQADVTGQLELGNTVAMGEAGE